MRARRRVRNQRITTDIDALQHCLELIAHKVARFRLEYRVRHQFDLAGLRQRHHSIHFFFSNALRQIKEIIGKLISSGEPAIDKCPVGSVQPALFAGRRKRSCGGFLCRRESGYSEASLRTNACDGGRQCVTGLFRIVAKNSSTCALYE